MKSFGDYKRITKEERTISSKAYTARHLKEPCFVIYDDSFLDVLGKDASIELILERNWKFAHEAPVYVPNQDAVYFTSAPPLLTKDAEGSKITISKAGRQQDGSWTCEAVPTDISMGNGAINYGKDGILFCAQGTKTEPGGIVQMSDQPPYATQTLVDGFHGRLFNSVNDIVTHTDGSVWFTDPTYGYDQGFREKPQLPSQVYCFEPQSGELRATADGFGRPNGLCFSPDEKTIYVTDTDMVHGDGSIDMSRAGTVYAFDVLERQGAQFLANRRLFAFTDSGIPDGIKCDMEGNVYSGCGDGVQVWNDRGRLIGKIVIPGGVANFCFTKMGEIFLLNEERIFLAKIRGDVQGALLYNLGIKVDART